MSADAILAAIRAESDREVTGVLAAARADADELVRGARAALDRHVTEALAAAEPELAADAARRVNVARLRLLHARARRRADRVAAVFDAARDELAAMVAGGDPRWNRARARLQALALEAIGATAVVEEEARGSAIRARSRDGTITVDASLDTRLARARALLADAVAELASTG